MIMTVSSCNISKYLDEGEYLVKDVDIELEDKENTKDSPFLEYNMQSLISQKPNRKYLAVYPRELIYFRNEEKLDTIKNPTGFLSHYEKPTIFERESMFSTASKMQNYLRNSRGYYYAKVYPVANKNGKRVKISYRVIANKQYEINSKEYFGEDDDVVSTIEYFEYESLIKPGDPIDEKLFDQEETRIVKKLQNLGYANFSKNHIEFAADSTGLDNEMNVFINILPPVNDTVHRKYTVGDIYVYTDFSNRTDTIDKQSFTYNNKKYFYTDYMKVRTQTLERMFSFETGEYFNNDKIDNTYTALVDLGTYRFVNIVPTISSEYDTVINYEVFLTPREYTWSFSGGMLEAYYTKSNNALIGLSSAPSLSNSNLLGGGEKASISLEGSVEFNTDPQAESLLQTYGYSVENSLKYPTLLDPYGITIIRLVSKDEDQFRQLDNKALTEFNLTYSVSQQLNQFQLNSTKASYGYTIRSLSSRYTWFITPAAFSYINNSADQAWLASTNNEFLERTFEQKSFLSSVLLNEIDLVVNTPVFSSGFSYTANITFEQSGAEVYALNSLFAPEKTWMINDSIQLSKFVKLDIETTANQTLTTKTSLAGRFRVGAIVPYAGTTVPFQKQLYVGGANSIRAFALRQLGPGGFNGILTEPDARAPFTQTGEMVLEANLEYRFPLYSYLKGAVFIDAGNMWVLDAEDSEPESVFAFSNFYNQIAVGYGAGIRLDIDFLVLRVDGGYILRYPFYNESINSYWNTPSFKSEYLRSINFNLAINYPF